MVVSQDVPYVRERTCYKSVMVCLCAGVGYTGLSGKVLYPMVSSTAARTGMRLIKACSFQTSLQFLCCQVLREIIPAHLDVIDALKLPPGLQAFLTNNLGWLLRPNELTDPAVPDPTQPHTSSMSLLPRKRNWSRRFHMEHPEGLSSSDEEDDLEGYELMPGRKAPRAKRRRRELLQRESEGKREEGRGEDMEETGAGEEQEKFELMPGRRPGRRGKVKLAHEQEREGGWTSEDVGESSSEESCLAKTSDASSSRAEGHQSPPPSPPHS